MERQQVTTLSMLRYCYLVIIIVLLMTGCSYAEATECLKIHFIGVGMGDAILLRYVNEDGVSSMMIDTGGRGTTSSVLKYLKPMTPSLP